MSDYCLLYVTTPNPQEARDIAQAVVREQLVACANIVDGMTSVYRWEGQVEEGQESILILKTRMAQTQAVTRRVVELHSYSCPCVVEIPLSGGHRPFLEWIEQETS